MFLQHQDYDIRSDLDGNLETEIIFAYRQGAGVDQHPSSNRGSAAVSFASGDVSVVRVMAAPSALSISYARSFFMTSVAVVHSTVTGLYRCGKRVSVAINIVVLAGSKQYREYCYDLLWRVCSVFLMNIPRGISTWNIHIVRCNSDSTKMGRSATLSSHGIRGRRTYKARSPLRCSVQILAGIHLVGGCPNKDARLLHDW